MICTVHSGNRSLHVDRLAVFSVSPELDDEYARFITGRRKLSGTISSPGAQLSTFCGLRPAELAAQVTSPKVSIADFLEFGRLNELT